MLFLKFIVIFSFLLFLSWTFNMGRMFRTMTIHIILNTLMFQSTTNPFFTIRRIQFIRIIKSNSTSRLISTIMLLKARLVNLVERFLKRKSMNKTMKMNIVLTYLNIWKRTRMFTHMPVTFIFWIRRKTPSPSLV